jgi:hypothetical protein
VDCGLGWLEGGRFRDVVANRADVIRNQTSRVVQCVHDAERHVVVRHKDCCSPTVGVPLKGASSLMAGESPTTNATSRAEELTTATSRAEELTTAPRQPPGMTTVPRLLPGK